MISLRGLSKRYGAGSPSTTSAGLRVERTGENDLVASGATIERIGDLAFDAGVRLHELSTREASLEQAYQELTAGSVEYGARTAGGDR